MLGIADYNYSVNFVNYLFHHRTAQKQMLLDVRFSSETMIDTLYKKVFIS